ncbi:three-Cys-motif partner protein TcmP [Pedobacter agri]|uniref:three-Cys-motif partner protein TcmP n=1 Tax=Pedobacter agri TaxID=454586 RepID=UPI00292E5AC6|nr:three-Cys-motif partner protein TcmP [Pedobacter agri]
MAAIDLHSKPFDEETITKLEIFENYAQAWLPTFIMWPKSGPTLCIFDFFAGTGYDMNGVPGSPIRFLKKIQEYRGDMFKNKIKVELYLNEFEPTKKKQEKFELLKKSCDQFLLDYPGLSHLVHINYSNEDCETLFPKLLPTIAKYPSLVYLDQNGVKFADAKYFLELEKTSTTDFLYFLSSSYFWRFGTTDEFKKHLNIDMVEAKKDPYQHIHRNILGQLKKKMPVGSPLKLYPFSIKRDPNIHGIIFGAKHPRAVDKFLTVAWEKNSLNGQANFDIDDDMGKQQMVLFGAQKPTKIEGFQAEVRKKILTGELQNNKQLFDFTLEQGHIATHAAVVLKEMKKNKEVHYNSISPLVNYDNAYKKSKILEYTVLTRNG